MTYLLIVSVLALWGFIFYRVADNASAKPAGSAAPEKMALPEADKVFIARDTFTLLLNYRDPFTGEIMEERIGNAPDMDAGPALPPAKPEPLKVDHIKYAGYIINPSSKRSISILTINGKEQMMTEGEVSGEVKLLRNRKDSVEVIYKGKTCFIRKS